eukprot:6214284-Pleurochrysis_carterae.AAC.1
MTDHGQIIVRYAQMAVSEACVDTKRVFARSIGGMCSLRLPSADATLLHVRLTKWFSRLQAYTESMLVICASRPRAGFLFAGRAYDVATTLRVGLRVELAGAWQVCRRAS